MDEPLGAEGVEICEDHVRENDGERGRFHENWGAQQQQYFS